ncbi:MAG: hypothetical protein OXF43_10000, partial [Gammaproteobacteria bacterium]|nr:hypothetical protein [Gammaproteobacteria bacterium]
RCRVSAFANARGADAWLIRAANTPAVCGGGVLSKFYADVLQEFEGKSPPFKLRRKSLPHRDLGWM